MAKSTKKKGLIIGGAVLGLLMGSSAMGAVQTSGSQGNDFFKFNEIKGSFQLAAAGEEDGEKKCGEEDKKCGEASCS